MNLIDLANIADSANQRIIADLIDQSLSHSKNNDEFNAVVCLAKATKLIKKSGNGQLILKLADYKDNNNFLKEICIDIIKYIKDDSINDSLLYNKTKKDLYHVLTAQSTSLSEEEESLNTGFYKEYKKLIENINLYTEKINGSKVHVDKNKKSNSWNGLSLNNDVKLSPDKTNNGSTIMYKEYISLYNRNSIESDKWNIIKEIFSKIPKFLLELSNLALETNDKINFKCPKNLSDFLFHPDSVVIHYYNKNNKIKIQEIINRNLSKNMAERGFRASSGFDIANKNTELNDSHSGLICSSIAAIISKNRNAIKNKLEKDPNYPDTFYRNVYNYIINFNSASPNDLESAISQSPTIDKNFKQNPIASPSDQQELTQQERTNVDSYIPPQNWQKSPQTPYFQGKPWLAHELLESIRDLSSEIFGNDEAALKTIVDPLIEKIQAVSTTKTAAIDSFDQVYNLKISSLQSFLNDALKNSLDDSRVQHLIKATIILLKNKWTEADKLDYDDENRFPYTIISEGPYKDKKFDREDILKLSYTGKIDHKTLIVYTGETDDPNQRKPFHIDEKTREFVFQNEVPIEKPLPISINDIKNGYTVEFYISPYHEDDKTTDVGVVTEIKGNELEVSSKTGNYSPDISRITRIVSRETEQTPKNQNQLSRNPLGKKAIYIL